MVATTVNSTFNKAMDSYYASNAAEMSETVSIGILIVVLFFESVKMHSNSIRTSITQIDSSSKR